MEEQLMGWIERFGGWAVVVFMLVWGMKRADKVIGQVTAIIHEVRTTQQQIVRDQAEIVRMLSELAKRN